LGASKAITGSLDILTDLTKGLDLLTVVVLHQKLVFYNIYTLKFALRSVDKQTYHDSFINAGSINDKFLTTLKEDLDFRARFG
jgi:hypothetical protein